MRLLPIGEAMKALAFSRDRAMQLDAMLRSLATHAAEPVEVAVICKATTERHARSYLDIGKLHPSSIIVGETNFENDVRSYFGSIAGEHVLFLVDDTIFVRRWSPVSCDKQLRANGGTIGYSLRLGMNTSYCYPLARDQRIPPTVGWPSMITWDWTCADGDFGYPLELSSSVYRTQDILAALSTYKFRNPNELEVVLSELGTRTLKMRPWLMAHETSVAFSNPCNKVQTIYHNRAGTDPNRSADALLDLWEQGYRIDVEALAGYVPRGAHEEAPLTFVRR